MGTKPSATQGKLVEEGPQAGGDGVGGVSAKPQAAGACEGEMIAGKNAGGNVGKNVGKNVGGQVGGRAGRSRGAWVVFLVVLGVVLGSDLIVKSWSFATVADEPVSMAMVRANEPGAIGYHEPVVCVPGILALHLTVNRGAVFGLGDGSQWLFIAVSVIAVVVVVRVFWVSPATLWLYHAGLGMLLGGALGNMYDRLRFMAVRDMFFLFPDVRLPFGWHWPGGNDLLYPWIFNVADVALLVGVLLLFVISWRRNAPQVSQ